MTDAGFDYHLTKPVDIDTLRDLLSRNASTARETTLSTGTSRS
jgi:hypothetical protein